MLADLAVDEVALLPNAQEADGRLQRIHLVERLTAHLRHRTKYLDVPVAPHHAFTFCAAGSGDGAKAATLHEFVRLIGRCPPSACDGYLRRGDFSRCVLDVFGDRKLAVTLRQLEENHRLGRISDINGAITAAVRARYELPA